MTSRALRLPPVVDGASVGVGVVPSATDVSPPRISSSSPSMQASSPTLAPIALHIVEAHAGILRLEIDRGFDADALVGGAVIGVDTACTPPRLPPETPMRSPVVLMPVTARQLAWMPPLPETRGISLRSGVSSG